MAEYISTFTTGFSEVIPSVLNNFLSEFQIIKLYDGLVYYNYNGNEEDIHKIIVFNNSFKIYRKFYGKNSEIRTMIKNVMSLRQLPVSRKSFRVRYSINNQFVSVDKSYTQKIENQIKKLTGCKIDRVSPDTEFWFIKRSENIGFFCQLLFKRTTTEKKLHKGELRPEFAYLMCANAKLDFNSYVLDPFAGYGAIPKQIEKNFKFRKLFVSDINDECIRDLSKQFKKNQKIEVKLRNALNIDDIKMNSIDYIITDPPWGYYEEIDNIANFYNCMLIEFSKILKEDGIMIILSARKKEFEKVVSILGFIIHNKIDTLVNGKKASVYIISCT